MTSVVVGPTATLTLAQQGAEVIKLEAPEGDLLRRLGGAAREAGMSPKFLHFNRGKRSIVIDLKTEAGRAVARRLAGQVDVFIANIRPAALGRLGLAWEDLRTLNPGLVHCTITGFGTDGRYAGRPAYDTIIQGLSGMADCMQRTIGEPRFMPFVAADHMVGFIAAQAICAALVARARTGLGQAVEVPMFENMVHFVLSEHMGQRSFDDDGAIGDPRIMDPSGRPVRTLDGWICVSANTDAQARGFFTAIGRPDLAEDPRFCSVAARARNVSAYFQLRAEALATRTTAEWEDALAQQQVPAMRMNTMDDLFHDPHLQDVGMIEPMPHTPAGARWALRAANRFSGGDATMSDPPRAGGDGAAILRQAGYDDAAITELAEAGAVVLP